MTTETTQATDYRYRSSQWFIWRTERGDAVDPERVVGYGNTIEEMEADASRNFVAWIKTLPEGASYEELWDGENYVGQVMECDACEFEMIWEQEHDGESLS